MPFLLKNSLISITLFDLCDTFQTESKLVIELRSPNFWTARSMKLKRIPNTMLLLKKFLSQIKFWKILLGILCPVATGTVFGAVKTFDEILILHTDLPKLWLHVGKPSLVAILNFPMKYHEIT